MEGLHLLGVDYGSILQSAGGIITSAVDVAQQAEKEKQLAGAEKKKLDTAIAADVAASNAAAKAAVSAQLKSASAQIDLMAAQSAIAAQDRAGAALSAESAELRVAAAEKQLELATQNAQATPKDGYKAALAAAWTQTVNKARNLDIQAAPARGAGKGGGAGSEKEPWLTRRVLGPVPGWGVVVGGGALATVLGYLVKKIFWG